MSSSNVDPRRLATLKATVTRCRNALKYGTHQQGYRSRLTKAELRRRIKEAQAEIAKMST